MNKQFFIGKDQTVFNALLVLFNERIITVWMHDPEAPAATIGIDSQPLKRDNVLGSCGSDWHYYQFWLSDRQARDEMKKIWSAKDMESQNMRWWKVHFQCRVTRVLALNSLLKRVFGEDWTTPVSTLATPARSWQH